MSFLADIAETLKPQPFTLTTMGGRVVWIRQMTARQVAQWWVWVYEKSGQRKQYDEQLVELFKRLACDEKCQDLLTSEEAAKLREQPGAGAVLAEFWTEAKRRNFLYQTADEEEAERDRFFIRNPQPTASKIASGESPASEE